MRVSIASSTWNPIPPAEIAEVLRGAPFFWCLAGGCSIERFVGRSFRAHEDTDIVILRSEQLALRDWLCGWRLCAVESPASRLWPSGEVLPGHVHDIWAHREGSEHWELQVMIQESAGDSWVYRRDDRVRGPLAGLAELTDGVPCLRIDLQLLYKSKKPRAKDELDFRTALPLLSEGQRATLAGWLSTTSPGHEWIDRLIAVSGGSRC